MMNNFIVHKDESAKTSVSFINLVYLLLCFSIMLTSATSYFLYTLNYTTYITTQGSFIVLFILQIGIVIALSAFINKLSTPTALILFIFYSILTGLTFSSFFIVYTDASIASAFFITAMMFLALSIFGYTTKKDLSSIGRFMFLMLVGLILATIVNIFLHNEMLDCILTYLSVLIFSCLIAYDTQKINAIQNQIDSNNSNYYKLAIISALTLYLDFVNLFISILKLTGNSRN